MPDWDCRLATTGSAAGTVGAENPIRYRGYYYDTETELYYCQSRYYNPEWGRWLNADEVFDGTNLFAYCGNNPVNMADESGHFGTPIQWACAAIGAIGGWFFGDYVARRLGYAKGWKYWAIRAGVTIGGAVIG